MLPDIGGNYRVDIGGAEETEMRLAGKTDANQAEIVQALRDAGCSVAILSDVGKGVPDLAVGRYGITVFMEVKAEGAKLTPAEIKFKERWKGCYLIVHNVQEALEALGIEVED